MYRNCYPFILFYCYPFLSFPVLLENVLNPKQSGELQIVLNFGVAPGDNITIILYRKFENLLEVDKNKAVFYDIYQHQWRKYFYIICNWIIWQQRMLPWNLIFTAPSLMINYPTNRLGKNSKGTLWTRIRTTHQVDTGWHIGPIVGTCVRWWTAMPYLWSLPIQQNPCKTG